METFKQQSIVIAIAIDIVLFLIVMAIDGHV